MKLKEKMATGDIAYVHIFCDVEIFHKRKQLYFFACVCVCVCVWSQDFETPKATVC